jgi:hypothetical protein
LQERLKNAGILSERIILITADLIEIEDIGERFI